MWLIIGYGNPLRADDGLGPLLAEKLAAALPEKTAKVVTAHQLTPELALEIAAPEIDRVLFVDAKRQLETAFNLEQLPPNDAGSCGHQTSPALLLSICAQLYQSPRLGWLLCVTGEDFSFAQQLSKTAKKNLAAATQQAIEFIRASGSHAK